MPFYNSLTFIHPKFDSFCFFLLSIFIYYLENFFDFVVFTIISVTIPKFMLNSITNFFVKPYFDLNQTNHKTAIFSSKFLVFFTSDF